MSAVLFRRGTRTFAATSLLTMLGAMNPIVLVTRQVSTGDDPA